MSDYKEPEALQVWLSKSGDEITLLSVYYVKYGKEATGVSRDKIIFHIDVDDLELRLK